MSVNESFGQNLRAARLAANLTQEELAARCGIHATSLSQIERGGRQTFVDTMVRLATALETTPNELCRGTGWERPEPDPDLNRSDPPT
jgi:transcriptional regulator with XRE-family HTH domain